MHALTVAAGVLLIAFVIWEVFKDLFHPVHGGALSDWIGRRLFNLLRGSRSRLALAGPLAVVMVIAAWVLLLVVGFCLVYYPSYPALFRTNTGELPPDSRQFLSSLYFSFETLITLGYGDIMPHAMPMRFIAATEGLIGFGLLTASVSSIVLLYPALSRMRLLARTVAHHVAAEQKTGASIVASGSEVLLASLAQHVTNARIDLVHFPIIYYFAAEDTRASLAHWVPELERLAREGLAAESPKHIRLAAAALDDALDDLSGLLAERFLQVDAKDRAAVFRALAKDHEVAR